MPYLYGQPRKDALRKEIRELSNELRTERKEHRETRDALKWAEARIALLTKKSQLMEGKLKDLLAEASQEISAGDVVEEARRRQKARVDAMIAAAKTEAEAASA